MPMGFVSVLDEEKQYIKSAQNVAVTEISLSEAFCVQTRNRVRHSFVMTLISTLPFVTITR